MAHPTRSANAQCADAVSALASATLTVATVPRPASLRISTRAPTRAARSCMPTSPQCPSRYPASSTSGAMPCPSSETVTRNSPLPSSTSTTICRAFACVNALRTASQAIAPTSSLTAGSRSVTAALSRKSNLTSGYTACRPVAHSCTMSARLRPVLARRSCTCSRPSSITPCASPRIVPSSWRLAPPSGSLASSFLSRRISK